MDVLKIDAEGHDGKVLRGAGKLLNSTLGMFAFEGGRKFPLTREDLNIYDSMGYSCFSTSKAGLFSWTHNCMSDEYVL